MYLSTKQAVAAEGSHFLVVIKMGGAGRSTKDNLN